eukprot:PhM_4_TR13251/c0_g1_i1/m.100929
MRNGHRFTNVLSIDRVLDDAREHQIQQGARHGLGDGQDTKKDNYVIISIAVVARQNTQEGEEHETNSQEQAARTSERADRVALFQWGDKPRVGGCRDQRRVRYVEAEHRRGEAEHVLQDHSQHRVLHPDAHGHAQHDSKTSLHRGGPHDRDKGRQIQTAGGLLLFAVSAVGVILRSALVHSTGAVEDCGADGGGHADARRDVRAGRQREVLGDDGAQRRADDHAQPVAHGEPAHALLAVHERLGRLHNVLCDGEQPRHEQQWERAAVPEREVRDGAAELSEDERVDGTDVVDHRTHDGTAHEREQRHE